MKTYEEDNENYIPYGFIMIEILSCLMSDILDEQNIKSDIDEQLLKNNQISFKMVQ